MVTKPVKIFVGPIIAAIMVLLGLLLSNLLVLLQAKFRSDIAQIGRKCKTGYGLQTVPKTSNIF